MCAALGLAEKKPTCVGVSCQESIVAPCFCIAYHWFSCNVHVWKLPDVLVGVTEGRFIVATESLFALEMEVCHVACWSLLLLTSPFPFKFQIWCEYYLTQAASDCEDGIAMHTFILSLWRAFFKHFRSSLDLMGSVRQASSGIMTHKWVEIVNSISNERRLNSMIRWGKSFTTREWCCLIPRGNYGWNAL